MDGLLCALGAVLARAEAAVDADGGRAVAAGGVGGVDQLVGMLQRTAQRNR